MGLALQPIWESGLHHATLAALVVCFKFYVEFVDSCAVCIAETSSVASDEWMTNTWLNQRFKRLIGRKKKKEEKKRY